MTKTEAIAQGAKDLYGDGCLHLEVEKNVWIEVWVPKAVQDQRVAEAAAAALQAGPGSA